MYPTLSLCIDGQFIGAEGRREQDIVNPALALAGTPCGGIKDSGMGSEGGSETFDGYLNTRFVTQLN